ncbi:malonic semialdehyde reductase [Streptomyces chartreusis]|uniref:malonic semialdehyde reductase n=1 Tax=Streptomyces chartreusis TaxID=1969 RepID=UPI00371468C0
MTAPTPLILDSAAQDQLFRKAHTAGTFSGQEVPESTVRAIYDLVKYGPTSFNQQPLRIVLVRSRDARERLVSHMFELNKEKTLGAPLTAILAADCEFHEHLPRLVPHLPDAKDTIFGAREMREASAQFNAALQTAYFIVGVRAAGLAAGPMTGYDAAGLNKEFFPGGDHKALTVINMGFPREDSYHPRLPRLGYDEIVSTV